MKPEVKNYLLIGLLVFAGYNAMTAGKAVPTTTPTEVPAVAGKPSPEMQAMVQPVVALRVKNTEAADKMAVFFRGAADVVRRDDSVIKTTGQFRTAKMNADLLYAQKTPIVGTLGSGPVVDAAIIQAISLEDAPLDVVRNGVKDSSKRMRLADMLDAIAWAFEGGK